MSFSGRLSIMDSAEPPFVSSTTNSIIPLSIAQRTNMESPTGSWVNPLVSNQPNQKRDGNRKTDATFNKSCHHKHSHLQNSSNNLRHHQNTNNRDRVNLSSTVKLLAKELLDTRANLKLHQTQIKRMREERELQLTVLCRQLLEFESGLRKTERELKAKIQQKDNKINEQANIIEFLVKKSGTKSRNIKDLCNEAVAKIPQIQPVDDNVQKDNNTANKGLKSDDIPDTFDVHGKSSSDDSGIAKQEDKNRNITNIAMKNHVNKQELTSIYEYSDSQNDNDSDSAIIIDDRLNNSLQRSHYKGISRSISDVVSCISSSDIKEMSHDNGIHTFRNNLALNEKIATPTYNKNEINGGLRGEGLDTLNGKGQKLPQPPSSITSLLGSNAWYSNDACGSLSPPLLLMRKHKTRMVTHLDTRVNSCSSEEEEEEEPFVEDTEDYTSSSPFTSANYRGFLLRHGSYERYKSRSVYQQHCRDHQTTKRDQETDNERHKTRQTLEDKCNSVTASSSSFSSTTMTPLNYCTLPRRSKSVTKLNRHPQQKDENQVHISNMSASSSTLIIVNQKTNGDDYCSTIQSSHHAASFPQVNHDKQITAVNNSLSSQSLASSEQEQQQLHHAQVHIKHKNFMKPRDVKNRSTQKQKQQKNMMMPYQGKQDHSTKKDSSSFAVSPTNFSQNVEQFVKKNGSVYCSLIMQETDLNSQSFA